MNKKIKNKGKSLEALIELLEKQISENENIKIEKNKRIYDKKAKRKREHDLVLTYSNNHHEFFISIECKDRSRKIGSSQVEGFWAKCLDTGINQGIIVSQLGFTKPALNKANENGIRCFSLDNALKFNWLKQENLTLIERKINKVHITLNTKILIQESLENYKLIDNNGNEIEIELFKNVITKMIKEIISKKEIRDLNNPKYLFDGNAFCLQNKNTMSKNEIISVSVQVELEILKNEIPFKLYDYMDKDKNSKISEVAVASLNVTGFDGKLILTKNLKGNINLNIINN